MAFKASSHHSRCGLVADDTVGLHATLIVALLPMLQSVFMPLIVDSLPTLRSVFMPLIVDFQSAVDADHIGEHFHVG